MFTAIYKTVQNVLSSDVPDGGDSTDGSRSDSDMPSYPASQSSYDDSSEFEPDVEVKNVSGKVTKLLSGYGLINDDIYFSFDTVVSQFRPRAGDPVNAVVFRDRKESGWRAKQVTVETKEWGDDDVPEDLIGMITKATRIETVINDMLQCTHDSIVQGYRPHTGDWIQACTYKHPETGTMLVKDVRPLREQKIYGTISHVYIGYGFIDDRTYFPFSACECGYAPQKGDRVIARCIESKQKRGNWRAVGVELKREKQLPRPEDLVVGPLQTMKADLMKDKCGIMITDKLDLAIVNSGKAKTINFWIRNIGIGLQLLKSFSVCNLHSEVTIAFPDKVKDEEEDQNEANAAPQVVSLMILPGLALQGTITVKAQNLGKFRELVTFDFGSFQIGRYVYMEVQDEKMKLVGFQGKHSQRRGNSLHKYKEQYFNSQMGIAVHGVRPTRTSNWNTPVKLKRHPVPEELVQCVLERMDITSLIPELLQSMCIENYFTIFSALLHLEEIQMEIDIRKYDLERESLRKRGEYLALEVVGLAEGRPSVLVGDKIILTPIDAQPNTVTYDGYVHEVHGEEVLLKFHPSFHEDYVAEEYHVTFTFSKTVLQRCHQAADMALTIGNRILFPTSKIIEVKPPQISITFPESQKVTKPNMRKPMVIPRVAAPARPRRGAASNQGYLDYRPRQTPSSQCQFIIPKFATSSPPRGLKQRENKVVGEYFDKTLNARQKIAVFRILQGQTRPTPYILFGPPGTGKTVTVVESILQVHHHVCSSRILACTPSNSAADLLTSRLAASGRVKQNDLVRLNSFRRAEDSIEESIKLYCTNSQTLELVAHHRIIICTCSTAGSFFQLKLRPGHFTHIYVDEAGQATEPESLIPVALATGDDSQIILAGDPMQLGPVLQSKEAIKLSLNLSLLERLMQRPVYRRDEKKFRDHGSYDPLLVTKLVDNYRSHACILHIPSNLFYHNELVVKADVLVRERFVSWERLPNKEKFPIIFHGIQGEELQEGNSPSWFNAAEAVQALTYVQALLQQSDQVIEAKDCGIITPYRKQVEKMRLLLTSVDIDGIKVGSVEEFQGQEKPVIIILTVRSGEDFIGFDLRHKLGFLSNPKRFNVSVTRAQGLLIVVGNPYVLAKDPKWLAMLTYCVRNNAYVGCELPDLEGQDEMELIRLEKSFYEMPCEVEPQKRDLNPTEEQGNGDEVSQNKEGGAMKEQEKVEMKDDSKEEHVDIKPLMEDAKSNSQTDQSLSNFSRDLGLFSNYERGSGVAGDLSLIDVAEESEETASFVGGLSTKEHCKSLYLEQNNSNLADVSSVCDRTLELENSTSGQHSHSKEYQSNLPSTSSNSSYLLDVTSNEQNVYKERGSLTSSGDLAGCQIGVCSKKLQDAREVISEKEEVAVSTLEDHNHVNSSTVTPDDNTEESSIKAELEMAAYSKRTTLEADGVKDCNINVKINDEVTKTALNEDFDKRAIICAVDGDFEFISNQAIGKMMINLDDITKYDTEIPDRSSDVKEPDQLKDLVPFSNVVNIFDGSSKSEEPDQIKDLLSFSNDAEIHDESDKLDKPNKMKDLMSFPNDAEIHDESDTVEEHNQIQDVMTFSDSDDSFVSTFVSGVISKQLISLQKELFKQDKVVVSGNEYSASLISVADINSIIDDINGSSVDPGLLPPNLKQSSAVNICDFNEQSFGIRLGSDQLVSKNQPDDDACKCSAGDDAIVKHPSDTRDESGKHPEIPTDDEDTDNKLKCCEGDVDMEKFHSDTQVQNTSTLNGKDLTDDSDKHASSTDAVKQSSHGNGSVHFFVEDIGKCYDGSNTIFTVGNDAAKHRSDVNGNAGVYSSTVVNSSKHVSDIGDRDGDADIHPDVDDVFCVCSKDPSDNISYFETSNLEVETNVLSRFDLTEHEDEDNLFTSTPLFPMQSDFPKRAAESTTSLCASQGSKGDEDAGTMQCREVEEQLLSKETKLNANTSSESPVLSGLDQAYKFDSSCSLQLSMSQISDDSYQQVTEEISEAISSLHLSSESSYNTYSGGNGNERSTSRDYKTMSDSSSFSDWPNSEIRRLQTGSDDQLRGSDSAQKGLNVYSEPVVAEDLMEIQDELDDLPDLECLAVTPDYFDTNMFYTSPSQPLRMDTDDDEPPPLIAMVTD